MRGVAVGTGFLLALLLGTGLDSCARGKKPSPAPVAATLPSGGAQTYRMTSAQGPMVQTTTEPRPAPPTDAPILAPGPGAPAAPRYLNIQSAPVEILPSDFGIGPLENLKARAGTRGSGPPGLDLALASFLDSVIAGKPRLSAVLAGRLPLVETILAGLPSPSDPGSPISYRLGAVKAAGEEAVAAFTLFAAPIDQGGPARLPPRSDGRIHARLVGTEWRIEDLSFDASGLTSDRALPDPPWQPSAPGSALSQGGTTETRP